MKKSYAHNLFHYKSKMRPLCSKTKKRHFSWPSRKELLQNGHFKNVQNRFAQNRMEKKNNSSLSLIYANLYNNNLTNFH